MSERETQIGNIVSEWIRPRQLTSDDEICVPCYLRARRVVDSSHRDSGLLACSADQGDPQPILQQIEGLVDVEGMDPSTSELPCTQAIPSESQQEEELVDVEGVGPSTSAV